MARLKLCDTELCWRCEKYEGTLLHMLYECEMTQNLWRKIILFVNKVLEIDVYQSPALCILGLMTDEMGMSYQQTIWCEMALTIGCRIVLRHWKSKNVITFNEWLEEMT
uniref:Reverse transcriptase zinc-binding domain-containing protein n=1 Tax=Acanthochromis polyacanthus TaxID=80966 RepID=A0A3Q1FEA2_9TELE